MKKYYIEYPRNFANEYAIYVLDNDTDATELGFSKDDRISRAKAIHLGIIRPNEARKNNEQWYGGLFGDCKYEGSYAEQLNECLKNSKQEAENKRAFKAFAAEEEKRTEAYYTKLEISYQKHCENADEYYWDGSLNCQCKYCKSAD
jgi:hypothetical protein